MRRSSVPRTAILAVVVCLAYPAAAWADGPEIRISGGGVADFLDPNPCDNFNTTAPFGESFFAVFARIDEDGNVRGSFFCAVEDCFVGPGPDDFADILIVGDLTDLLGAKERGQDRVALGGDAVLFIEGVDGIADQFAFTVELLEGGPGVGGFVYTDPVTLLGAGIEYGDGLVDDGSDRELITRGRIRIRFDD